MTSSIDIIIDDIIRAEGGYTDNPADPGGETMYGITVQTARANGYTGAMKDLPRATAYKIYFEKYVVEPGFDKILSIAPLVAAEMVDSGVNLGPAWPGKWLQIALNAFNNGGETYPDLVVDGNVGPGTIAALAAYLKARKNEDGERVMLVALNCQQGARYLELCQTNRKLEAFEFGWFRNRVTAHV